MRCSLVAAVAALLLFVPGAAAADTYTVDTCATASGAPATVEGWAHEGNAYRAGIDCPGTGIVGVEPAAGPAYPDVIQFALYFSAPAGTRIAGFRLWRTVTLTSAWVYSLHESNAAGPRFETCGPPCNSLARPLDGPPNVSVSGRDTDSVDIHASCEVRCPGGDQTLITVRRLQVDLTDDSDPTFTSPVSGDLFDTSRPLSGIKTASFSAADQGSGVYLARLEVDGQSVAVEGVDGNGGRCVKPFKDLVPCRASAAGSISLDTASLTDGPHSVRLIVADATETNTVIYGPVQVTTSNQSTGCAPAVSPDVTARFASTSRATYTRRGVAPFSLTGTAPPGASLSLQALESRTGAQWAVAGTGTAGADGRFRLQVPAGPSRSLRVAFRASPLTRELSCSNVLQLRVPARVSLGAKRQAARRYRISGRLLGGFIPARGKLVELQAYERGKWRTFGSARSNASGRYAYTYRFRAESIGRRFRLRARVRADAAYPFSLGYSKVLRVRVR
jgi:hypothetical protein